MGRVPFRGAFGGTCPTGRGRGSSLALAGPDVVRPRWLLTDRKWGGPNKTKKCQCRMPPPKALQMHGVQMHGAPRPVPVSRSGHTHTQTQADVYCHGHFDLGEERAQQVQTGKLFRFVRACTRDVSTHRLPSPAPLSPTPFIRPCSAVVLAHSSLVLVLTSFLCWLALFLSPSAPLTPLVLVCACCSAVWPPLRPLPCPAPVLAHCCLRAEAFAKSLATSFALSSANSFAKSIAKSLANSLAKSPAKSLAKSLGVIWGSSWGHLGIIWEVTLGSSGGHLGVVFFAEFLRSFISS